MAAWTWRTWPDVLIDFGREAYVAWRLSAGDALHRDVVYVSGPLSPHWNALWFRLLGVGLDTLFVLNGLVLAALVAVWFGLLRRAADPLGAWAACAVFLTVFGFSQYVGIGNYNYLAPYSHELPHGLLLAALSLLCWTRAAAGTGAGWAAAAGLGLGLTALTKPEVTAAAALAHAVFVAGCLGRDGGRASGRRLLAFAAGVAVPVVAATLALAGSLGAEGALRAVAVAWLRIAEQDPASLPFYQRSLGTDELPANLGAALLWAGKAVLLFAPIAAAAAAWEGRPRPRWAPAACAVVLFAVLVPFEVRWLQAARALPVFALAGTAVFLAALRGLRADPDPGVRLLRAALFVFAMGMLAKIFFNARVHQYGFALALPATLLGVAAVVSWIPREIDRRGGYGSAFRGAAVGVLAAAVAGCLQVAAPYATAKTSRLGGVDDAIAVHPGVARVLGGALEVVQARTRPGDPLTVMPEGAMLNFLARRPLPTPHFSFNPFEVLVYGEDEMIRALEATPPAAVVLVHHDTGEHGARFLGRDYGIELLAWVHDHYRLVRQIGEPPLQPETRFGVQVLERRGGRSARR